MTPPLPISETFTSIQGEGKLVGTPSFFIRLAGCNLRCSWCDTPYASWSPESEPKTIDDLLAEAETSPANHIVITGGEPLIFPQITPLTAALHAAGYHITIETAGTVCPDITCDLISISPKLGNSTPIDDPRDPDGSWAKRHEKNRLNPQAINTLLAAAPSRQLKFVVTSPSDLPEIDALLETIDPAAPISPADILLMPEGITTPSAQQTLWIVNTCLERGWRFCPRLHITLFGNTRGT
jgi:7-carboxy-7-deazaguanine synthase